MAVMFLLGCDTMQYCGKVLMFQRSVVPPSSLHTEDGGSTDLWNVDILPNTTEHRDPEYLDLRDNIFHLKWWLLQTGTILCLRSFEWATPKVCQQLWWLHQVLVLWVMPHHDVVGYWRTREPCHLHLWGGPCHAMKKYGGGGIAPRILDLSTRRRWVVSFTPRPLYPQQKIPQYPFDRRMGWHQS